MGGDQDAFFAQIHNYWILLKCFSIALYILWKEKRAVSTTAICVLWASIGREQPVCMLPAAIMLWVDWNSTTIWHSLLWCPFKQESLSTNMRAILVWNRLVGHAAPVATFEKRRSKFHCVFAVSTKAIEIHVWYIFRCSLTYWIASAASALDNKLFVRSVHHGTARLPDH